MGNYHTRREQDREHEYELRRHEPRPGDRMPLDQRMTIAKLVGYCEGLVGAGLLGEEVELKLRVLIAETLVIIDLPSARERANA